MVQTLNLRKEFSQPKGQKVLAVDGVTFTAVPGQIMGILGANGAGKTTTLRMLATTLTPTSGTAVVCGHDVTQDSAKVRASIGFLSNSTAVYPRLNPAEALSYFGSLYGLSGQDLAKRVDYVIDRLGITEFKDRLCDKLSTGQKQRVSIARAILHDPPVLFFDEPTAGLDVVSGQTVLEFIEECRSAGKTVIFSTHIMAECERLCDHVAIIHEGRIFADGTVASLKEKAGADTMEKAFLNLVGYQRKEGLL